MRMFAGLDVGFKRTSVCVVDETGKIVWRGVVDTPSGNDCRGVTTGEGGPLPLPIGALFNRS